jgi:hypothetical protein
VAGIMTERSRQSGEGVPENVDDFG